jgi:hypothetical protein
LFESLYEAEAIEELVRALHRFAAQFEGRGAPIPSAPALAVGGVEVNPALVAALRLCGSCGKNVELGRDRKCPNCGTAL